MPKDKIVEYSELGPSEKTVMTAAELRKTAKRAYEGQTKTLESAHLKTLLSQELSEVEKRWIVVYQLVLKHRITENKTATQTAAIISAMYDAPMSTAHTWVAACAEFYGKAMKPDKSGERLMYSELMNIKAQEFEQRAEFYMQEGNAKESIKMAELALRCRETAAKAIGLFTHEPTADSEPPKLPPIMISIGKNQPDTVDVESVEFNPDEE